MKSLQKIALPNPTLSLLFFLPILFQISLAQNSSLNAQNTDVAEALTRWIQLDGRRVGSTSRPMSL